MDSNKKADPGLSLEWRVCPSSLRGSIPLAAWPAFEPPGPKGDSAGFAEAGKRPLPSPLPLSWLVWQQGACCAPEKLTALVSVMGFLFLEESMA